MNEEMKKLFTEFLTENLTIEISSESEYESDSKYINVNVTISIGGEWITSDNLSFTFFYLNQQLAINFAKNFPLMCNVLAACAVILELSWVLFLIDRKFLKYLIGPTILMHVGFYLMLNILYSPFIYCLLFFIPWTPVVLLA